MEREDFVRRLVQLRMNKGVSARDMSLSLGQAAGYINSIENGHSLPSLAMFFYICDYFGITPREFFDTESTDPVRLSALLDAAKGLTGEQIQSLTVIANGLRSNNKRK